MSLKEKNYFSYPIYSGKIISVKKQYVFLPNKKMAFREVVEHSGGVGIIAVNDKNELLLVEQYRSPINRLLLEIPAGKLEPDEEPLPCAIRELREETGYDAKEYHFICKFYPSPGYTNEVIHLFYAKDIFFNPLKPDDEEFLKVKFLPLKDINKILNNSNIVDGKTIIALLNYLLYY